MKVEFLWIAELELAEAVEYCIDQQRNLYSRLPDFRTVLTHQLQCGRYILGDRLALALLDEETWTGLEIRWKNPHPLKMEFLTP